MRVDKNRMMFVMFTRRCDNSGVARGGGTGVMPPPQTFFVNVFCYVLLVCK